jgi:hypothetical protein
LYLRLSGTIWMLLDPTSTSPPIWHSTSGNCDNLLPSWLVRCTPIMDSHSCSLTSGDLWTRGLSGRCDGLTLQDKPVSHLHLASALTSAPLPLRQHPISSPLRLAGMAVFGTPQRRF